MSRNPKSRAIIWNDDLEVAFLELKHMVSSKTLLNHPDWAIMFTLYTYASNKHLSTVISQDDKTITLFLRKVSKPQHNYTTIEK